MSRRTQKTRAALHAGLLQQLRTRAWEEIDVQGLCKAADVGRSTFYEHYANREALLLDCFAEIGAAFAAAGAARVPRGGVALAFVAPLIEHIHGQKAVFRLLLGRRANAFVRQQFQTMLVTLIRAELGRHRRGTKWRNEALAHAIGGSVFGMIHWWVDRNEPRSPDEVAAIINLHAAAMMGCAAEDSPR
jgi:AcrR family transcriptional regulator